MADRQRIFGITGSILNHSPMSTDKKEGMTIEQGNRLIAVFVGAEIIAPIGFLMRDIKFPVQTDGLYVHSVKTLKYHSSWDWLMPVVEKIEGTAIKGFIKTWVSINGRECGMWTYFDAREILREQGTDGNFKVKHTAKSKIEATWLAVVEFIQWYNNQTK